MEGDIEMGEIVPVEEQIPPVEEPIPPVENNPVKNELFVAVHNKEWKKAFWIIQTKATKFEDFATPEISGKKWTILQYACAIGDYENFATNTDSTSSRNNAKESRQKSKKLKRDADKYWEKAGVYGEMVRYAEKRNLMSDGSDDDDQYTILSRCSELNAHHIDLRMRVEREGANTEKNQEYVRKALEYKRSAKHKLKQAEEEETKALKIEKTRHRDEIRATEYVRRIFEIMLSYVYDNFQFDEFVNNPGPFGDTALKIAITRGYQQAVSELILHSADVNIEVIPRQTALKNWFKSCSFWRRWCVKKTDQRKVSLALIYKEMHTVITTIFDKGLTIETGKLDKSNEYLWTVKCDFAPITGVKSNFSTYLRQEPHKIIPYNELRETGVLASVLKQPSDKQEDVISHPLVQIFLYLKYQRYWKIIWGSVFFHVLWYILAVLLLMKKADVVQPNTNQTLGDNATSENTTNNNATIDEYSIYAIPDYIFYPWINWTILVFYIIFIIKEIIEIVTCPDDCFYWEQYENRGQWVLLIIATLAIFNPGYEILSVIYIVGIIVALLLVQGQTTKIEALGIYNEMLAQSFKTFGFFFIAYIPILLSFLITFKIVLKKNSLISFPKLMAMMTGEINYNDVFKLNEEQTSYPTETQVVLVIFVVTVVILLQNLLIGFAVEDVAELRKKCIVKHLAARLEVIFLIENIFTRRPFQIFFKRDKLLVGPASDSVGGYWEASGEYKHDLHLFRTRFNDLPESLRNTIRNFIFKKKNNVGADKEFNQTM